MRKIHYVREIQNRVKLIIDPERDLWGYDLDFPLSDIFEKSKASSPATPEQASRKIESERNENNTGLAEERAESVREEIEDMAAIPPQSSPEERAQELLLDGELTIEEIAARVGLTVDEVEKLAKPGKG